MTEESVVQAISTRSCVLRRWRKEDAESLVRHANNRNIWINLRDSFPHPYTSADANRWIGRTRDEQPILNFALEVDQAAVGAIGLHPKRDVYRRSAEIGYWLGEKYWGRGIVTEAIEALTGYAFTTLDLVRLSADVFEWNDGSMRALEKAGYEREAKLRRAAIKDGKIIDVFVYAKIRG
jgi:RimJ/RimL family protein N-acetyltransferase